MNKTYKQLLKKFKNQYKLSVYSALVLENAGKNFPITVAEKDQFQNDYLLHCYTLSALQRILTTSKTLSDTLPAIRAAAADQGKEMYNNYLIGKKGSK